MSDYTPIDALCDGYVMPEKRAEPHPFVKAEFAEWCGYCGAPEGDPRHTNADEEAPLA